MAKKPAAKAKKRKAPAIALKSTKAKKKPTKKVAKPDSAPKSEDLAAGLFVIEHGVDVLDRHNTFSRPMNDEDSKDQFQFFGLEVDAAVKLQELRKQFPGVEGEAKPLFHTAETVPARKHFGTHHYIDTEGELPFEIKTYLAPKGMHCMTVKQAVALARREFAGTLARRKHELKDGDKTRNEDRRIDLARVKDAEAELKEFDAFAKKAVR